MRTLIEVELNNDGASGQVGFDFWIRQTQFTNITVQKTQRYLSLLNRCSWQELLHKMFYGEIGIKLFVNVTD